VCSVQCGAERRKDIFESIKREAERILKKGKGSHDLEHTERVLKLATRIGRKEKAGLEIIRLAAVLHDIARRAEDRSGGRLDHAAQGAKLAAVILKKYDYPVKKTRMSAIAYKPTGSGAD